MAEFSQEEIATIRKFFDWIEEGGWLGRYNDQGLTGANDEGALCTEYNATEDYGSPVLEKEESVIPWLALTDPGAYDRQVQAERAAEKRRAEQQREESARQREAQERASYEALKAKYG